SGHDDATRISDGVRLRLQVKQMDRLVADGALLEDDRRAVAQVRGIQRGENVPLERGNARKIRLERLRVTRQRIGQRSDTDDRRLARPRELAAKKAVDENELRAGFRYGIS